MTSFFLANKIKLSKFSSIDDQDLPTVRPDIIRSRSSKPDDGIWLIAIVFGYIFGLFLIFVIVWFIWYGTSLKRKYQYKKNCTQTLTAHNSHLTMRNKSPSMLPQYDYSATSSLNWPISNSFGLNQIHEHQASQTQSGPMKPKEVACIRASSPACGS